MTDKDRKNAHSIEDQRQLFAALCQSARALSGLSTLELSEKTKVPLVFIESIESGQEDIATSKVYTRGFLRILCKCWEVDVQDYLTAYELAYPSEVAENTSTMEAISEIQKSTGQGALLSKEAKNTFVNQIGQGVKTAVTSAGAKIRKGKKPSQSEKPSETDSKLRTILPIAAGFLLVIGVTFLTDTFKGEDTSSHPVAAKLPIVQSAKPLVSEQPNIKSQGNEVDVLTADQPNLIKPEPESSPPTEESPAPVAELPHPNVQDSVVTIYATAPVLVKVRSDNSPRKNNDLAPGEELKIVFGESAQVLIMDASRVQLSFNGRALGKLGDPGRIRKLSFSNSIVTPGKTF